MKKLVKILVIIEFILILLIISLALIDKKQTMPTAFVVEENPSIEKIKFKVLTKAVCEEKSNHVFCHDELFIKCVGKEYLASNESLHELVECNKIKLNLSDIRAKGNTEFKKEWIDPRNNP